MRLLAQLISIFSLLTLIACSDRTISNQINGSTMGTYYQISLITPTALALDESTQLQQAIEQRLKNINQQMSTYLADSDITRFNQSTSTDWVSVPKALADITHNALIVSEQSHGAFDPTIYPLVKLWGFGEQFRSTIPKQVTLDHTKDNTGYQFLSVQLNPPALKKTKPSIMLDLSAIAKGYAVDQLSDLLIEAGYENHMVDIGGEIVAKGTNSKQQPWRIGIEKPSSHVSQRTAVQGISLNNQSIATSGSYRNYFEQEGKRYSHTIDPNTGKPVDHTLASATVIHPSNQWADAYATTLMVLGAEKGLAFAEQHKLAVYLISHEGSELKTQHSSAFEPYLSAH